MWQNWNPEFNGEILFSYTGSMGTLPNGSESWIEKVVFNKELIKQKFRCEDCRVNIKHTPNHAQWKHNTQTNKIESECSTTEAIDIELIYSSKIKNIKFRTKNNFINIKKEDDGGISTTGNVVFSGTSIDDLVTEGEYFKIDLDNRDRLVLTVVLGTTLDLQHLDEFALNDTSLPYNTLNNSFWYWTNQEYATTDDNTNSNFQIFNWNDIRLVSFPNFLVENKAIISPQNLKTIPDSSFRLQKTLSWNEKTYEVDLENLKGSKITETTKTSVNYGLKNFGFSSGVVLWENFSSFSSELDSNNFRIYIHPDEQKIYFWDKLGAKDIFIPYSDTDSLLIIKRESSTNTTNQLPRLTSNDYQRVDEGSGNTTKYVYYPTKNGYDIITDGEDNHIAKIGVWLKTDQTIHTKTSSNLLYNEIPLKRFSKQIIITSSSDQPYMIERQDDGKAKEIEITYNKTGNPNVFPLNIFLEKQNFDITIEDILPKKNENYTKGGVFRDRECIVNFRQNTDKYHRTSKGSTTKYDKTINWRITANTFTLKNSFSNQIAIDTKNPYFYWEHPQLGNSAMAYHLGTFSTVMTSVVAPPRIFPHFVSFLKDCNSPLNAADISSKDGLTMSQAIYTYLTSKTQLGMHFLDYAQSYANRGDIWRLGQFSFYGVFNDGNAYQKLLTDRGLDGTLWYNTDAYMICIIHQDS